VTWQPKHYHGGHGDDSCLTEDTDFPALRDTLDRGLRCRLARRNAVGYTRVKVTLVSADAASDSLAQRSYVEVNE
jgi:hypothetical protein